MKRVRFFPLAAAALALAGCLSSPGPDRAATASAPAAARPVDVFYVTDRAPARREDGGGSYSAERSHQLSFGSVAVLGADAEGATVSPATEIGRFPATPYAIERARGGVRRAPETIVAHERSLAEMQGELARRLAATGRKEIVVFVHGYNNSFDDAARSAAQLCNDMGPNDFLCIALTWPSGGSGGILFGYEKDTESGEFAVVDIRKGIRVISGTPGLRKLHFIAHSRGTDVLTAAMQHLAIEAYVSQSSLSHRFKIANVVLAAPDIDIDVAFARLLGIPSDPDLPYGRAPQRSVVFNTGNLHFTVYSSESDRALNLSKFLNGSRLRLGLLDLRDNPNQLSELKITPEVAGVAEFISVQGGGGLIGHSYFLSDPTVRADLVALIRDGKVAGDPGRPLVEVKRPFWYLPDRPQAAR